MPFLRFHNISLLIKVRGVNVHEGELGEYSNIVFEVELKRRSGYAVLTIYVPSLILLVISYVTLYFTPQIFEVRVMGALTALLVVATIFTQVSLLCETKLFT